jgi:hypothetical protein
VDPPAPPAELCALALTATAAQLATTIAGYRTAAGTRITQERDRGLTWTTRDNGTVDVRLRLPAEDAAILLAALNAAKDQYGTPPEPDAGSKPDAGSSRTDPTAGDTDTTPAYTSADAILDLARVFLHTAPDDRSGEDRSLVVVQVHADQLTSQPANPGDVPAGTSDHPPRPTAAGTGTGTGDVPAGTSGRADPTCHLQGGGGIEPETARKLACDTDLLGAILDTHRGVLALGRTRRLVTRTLRRALMIRDRGRCQFTGCHQTRHLKAHHLIHWADGGPTDLDNLILLCQFHHTAVHEGQMAIRRSQERSWEFWMPDGKPHRDWYTAEGLLNFLTQHADTHSDARTRAETAATINDVDGLHHPDAQRIQPRWRGERYDRQECVQALFRMPVRTTEDREAA